MNLWNLTSGIQMNPVGTNRWNQKSMASGSYRGCHQMMTFGSGKDLVSSDRMTAGSPDSVGSLCWTDPTGNLVVGYLPGFAHTLWSLGRFDGGMNLADCCRAFVVVVGRRVLVIQPVGWFVVLQWLNTGIGCNQLLPSGIGTQLFGTGSPRYSQWY